MHIDDERIEHLLHEELSEDQEKTVRSHLADCAVCRDRFQSGRADERELLASLEQLDDPVPQLTASDVIVASRRVPRSVGLPWAAGVAFTLVAAGAAYAAPGSPVRGWVETVTDWLVVEEEAAVQDEPATPEPFDPAGLVFDPRPNVMIVFAGAPEGDVEIVLTDDASVTVQALGGGASFTDAGGGLIVVDGEGAGPFQILLPRSVPRFEVRAGDRTLFLKEGSIVTTAAEESPSGSYRIRLAS